MRPLPSSVFLKRDGLAHGRWSRCVCCKDILRELNSDSATVGLLP